MQMARKKKISGIILILGIVNMLFCLACFMLIGEIIEVRVDGVYLLLSAFACFTIGYSILYYFYFIRITRFMQALSEKIRERFLKSEIPRKYHPLDEEDGLARLEERVDLLIESREKEVQQFENLDSYRKEYLGNVSHELKTPVFNIQGYVDTLINGGLHDNAVNMEYLRRAEKSIDRLIQIIDDLETITQLESGGLELDLEPFDIAALCKDIYASLELNAAKMNISLEMARKYDKPVNVRADKFRIRQVLVNLVANSIKYGRENGTTVISLSYLNDDVIVEISDNGGGIDEKHIQRIFERFYRVDKGRSREQGGTGLGLAIVKHIIEAHGKSIRAESVPGRGTKFVFSLPAAF
jgi:two-component system, OmpR family, phosphate regulon sensor histidine kinase PhoR